MAEGLGQPSPFLSYMTQEFLPLSGIERVP